ATLLQYEVNRGAEFGKGLGRWSVVDDKQAWPKAASCTDEDGCRCGASRASARYSASRSQAWKHSDRCAGATPCHGFWSGETYRRRWPANAIGHDRWHAKLHGTRTGASREESEHGS